MVPPSSPTILITGATGYVGSHLVDHYLSLGWKVVAHARSDARAAALKASRGNPANLSTVVVKMGPPGCWDEAVKGVDYVIHSATVADFFKKIDPVKDMVDPIVNGVIELLKACFKESSVKSVINISSVSTMTNPLGNPEIRRFTADDYIPVDVDVTDLNILVVYGVAKARAEKMALQMMAEQKSCHFRLNSVVLPSVIGPLPEPEFQAGLRGEVVNKTSIEFIFSVVKREMGDDVRLDRWIDVRDLVTTLGNLLTAEHVNGKRFMLHADEPFDPPKVAEMLRENFDWAKEVIPDGHPRIDTFWEMDTKPLKDAVGISAKYDLKQSALESIEQAWKLGQVESKNSV